MTSSGCLSVATVSGGSIPVSQVTSTTLTSWALGSLPSIQSQLANYTAFDIYQQGTVANEFVGLPKSEDLMRSFDENLQLVLTGKSSVADALSKTQQSWSSVIE